MSDADRAMERLREELLQEVRRSGDEALLMFSWPPNPHLYGVPLSLTDTSSRVDHPGRPAADLDEWLDSVITWSYEGPGNWYRHGASRRRVDDYIELRLPAWPTDRRFYGQTWERSDWGDRINEMLGEDGLRARPELEAFTAEASATGAGLAWEALYENTTDDSPFVAHATTRRTGPETAELDFLDAVPGLPESALLDLVHATLHAAADAGVRRISTRLRIPHLEILGFRRRGGEMVVDTDFCDQDVEAAAAVLRAALAEPGGGASDDARRFTP